MLVSETVISIKGRPVRFPALKVHGLTIVVKGRWLRAAYVQDEAWLESQPITDPAATIQRIRDAQLKVDIFSFAQRIPDVTPRYPYPIEWDNVAAIDTGDFNAWWMSLPHVTRKNVRRAAKRGLVVQSVRFDKSLVRAIMAVNNETPMRQGRPFWHYGKSFDTVMKDYATFLDQSEYIGAYYDGELVGFIKMLYQSEVASIMQLLCMNSHHDKRPSNALVAKAVEICHAAGVKHLLYGKYIYGNNSDSPLTRFKRSNGFRQVWVPRYFVPITRKGQLAVRLTLHRGLKSRMPRWIMASMRRVRAKWHDFRACSTR
jgi:hypothetical protein